MSRDNFGRIIGTGPVNARTGTIDVLTVGESPHQYVLPTTVEDAQEGMTMRVGEDTNELTFARLDHGDLTNHGTHTHAEIDAFINSHGGDDHVEFKSVHVHETLQVDGESELDSAVVRSLTVGSLIPVDPPGDRYTFPATNPFVANKMFLTDGTANLQFADFDHAAIANRGTVSHADLDILHARVNQDLKTDSEVEFKSVSTTHPIEPAEVHTDNIKTKQIEHRNEGGDVKFQTFVNNANDLVTQVKDNANTALTIYSGVSKIETLAAQVSIVASSARIASAAFSVTKGSIELGHELEDYKNADLKMNRKTTTDETVIQFGDWDGDPTTAVRLGQFSGSNKLQVKNSLGETVLSADPATLDVDVQSQLLAQQVTIKEPVAGEEMYSMVLVGDDNEELEITYHGDVAGTSFNVLKFQPTTVDSGITSTYERLDIPRAINVGDATQMDNSINCRRRDNAGAVSAFTLGTNVAGVYTPDWSITQEPYPDAALAIQGGARPDRFLHTTDNYQTVCRTDEFKFLASSEDSGNSDLYLINQGPAKRARLTFANDTNSDVFYANYDTTTNKLTVEDGDVTFVEFQPDGLTGNFQVSSKLNDAGATGDLLVGDSGVLEKLPIGSDDQVLTVSGGTAAWAARARSTMALHWAGTVSTFGDLRFLVASGDPTNPCRVLITPIVAVSLPVACKLIKATYYAAANDNTTEFEVFKNGNLTAVSVIECTAAQAASVTPTVLATFAAGDTVAVGHQASVGTGGTDSGETNVILLFEIS